MNLRFTMNQTRLMSALVTDRLRTDAEFIGMSQPLRHLIFMLIFSTESEHNTFQLVLIFTPSRQQFITILRQDKQRIPSM
jgi:hypothetical protein